MGKPAKTWFSVLQKLLFVITTIASIFIIILSAYVFVSAYQTKDTDDADETGSTEGPETFNVTTYATERDDGKSFNHNVVIGDKDVHETYRTIVLTCGSMGLITAFVQACVGLIGLMASTGRMRNFTKLWMFVNFFAFILILLCIFLPLSYGPKTGESLTSMKEFKEAFNNTAALAFQKDTYAKLSQTVRSAPYLIFLSIYEAVLLTATIISALFFKCGGKDYEKIDDSESMDSVSGKHR